MNDRMRAVGWLGGAAVSALLWVAIFNAGQYLLRAF
jgi:hypothetical protein